MYTLQEYINGVHRNVDIRKEAKMTDKALLKSFLALKSMTMQELSDKTGISLSSLNYKLNEDREFRQSEIKAIQDVLELSNEERDNIFFKI